MGACLMAMRMFKHNISCFATGRDYYTTEEALEMHLYLGSCHHLNQDLCENPEACYLGTVPTSRLGEV